MASSKKKPPAKKPARRGALKQVATALAADVPRETSAPTDSLALVPDLDGYVAPPTVLTHQLPPTDSPTDSPTDDEESEPDPSEVERMLEVERICGGRVIMADVRPEDCRPLASVTRHPRNPNEGDLGEIMESIKVHGLYRRIVVQKCTPEGRRRMLVIAGNHTHEAAEKLGYKAIPMEFVVCTDRAATKILPGDNRLTRLGTDNKSALAELLKELAEADDLRGTGYDADDVDQLLYELNHGEDDDESSGSSGDLLGLTEVTVADPRHPCEVGDVWKLGRHLLFVCDVFLGWPEWKKALRNDEKDLFCPFPGPFVATSSAGEKNRLILVQPDPYVAGHIVDRFAEIHGEKLCTKVEGAEFDA